MSESTYSYYAFIHDTIITIGHELIAKQGTILDFGCGGGLLTSFIQNSFFNAKVIGVDSDAMRIEENKTVFPIISFFSIKDQHLPFEDNYFDLIYTVNVFHHIKQADHATYVSELMRILKPNGLLLLFEFNPYNIFSYIRFKREHEQDTKMISPVYASYLFNSYAGIIKLKYYFLSQWLPLWLKEYMQYLPIGSVYCLQLYKK